MLDYLRDIKPLEDQGIDDATIASHLSARTKDPIPCEDAKVLLEGSGAIVEDPVTQQRSGSLIDHYGSLPVGEEKSLLSWFISHVMVRGVQVTSHDYPRSIQLAVVVAGLPANLEPLASDIIALGGGQPDKLATVQDVVDCRNEYIAEQDELARQDSIHQLQAEIENTWINPAISDGVSTADEVRAAIKAGL